MSANNECNSSIVAAVDYPKLKDVTINVWYCHCILTSRSQKSTAFSARVTSSIVAAVDYPELKDADWSIQILS